MCSLVSDLALGANANLNHTIDVVLNHVTAQLGADAADVLIYEAAKQTLQYAGNRGFQTRAFERSATRLTLADQVVRDRRMAHCHDLRQMKNEWARSRELIDEGFITYVGLPLIANEQLHGVLEIFQREHFNPNSEWISTAEDIAERAAGAFGCVLSIRRLQRANRELAEAYDATVEGWARALELRDYEPKGHSQRVTEMTMEFARVMQIAEADIVHIRRGAMLHDVGKMGLPDSILVNPGSLSDAEIEIMRRHPTIAYELLSPIEMLRPALDIPFCHHEKWDGTGYPRRLAGEAIPLAARIFAIVDVWDALATDRPYRKAWPKDKVCQHIRDQGGKHFDQKLADVFVKLLETDLKRKQAESSGSVHRTYNETIFKL